MEIVIFVTFVVIQYAAKAAPSALKALTTRSKRCEMLVLKLSDNHFVVWLGHPAIIHGLHDYVIHFVVYSGYVLRAH